VKKDEESDGCGKCECGVECGVECGDDPEGRLECEYGSEFPGFETVMCRPNKGSSGT
jgi:hypothetical protein